MARAQKPSGRATPRTHRGSATGRDTKPIPKDVRRSPRWFGPLVIGLLLLGAFLLVGNYLSFLPGAVSPWYLVAGFISIVAGFGLSTKLR
jgi:hypothetical protein